MEKTDKDLYTEFLNGNEESFKEIILRHKNNLIYFIAKYVKNIEIAEDISQDVFVYILVNKEKYNFKYELKTYLYMIAKSRAINYIKREKRIINLQEDENFYKEELNLEDIILKKQIQEEIRQAIDKMKREYQIVIYLVDFEKLSYREVSKIMEKTELQIKSLVHNARKKLKKILEKEGFNNEK